MRDKKSARSQIPSALEDSSKEQRLVRGIIDDMNSSNGYSPSFRKGRVINKEMLERSVFREFMSAFEAQYAVRLRNPSQVKNDPPDFRAGIEGKIFGIELVEFVTQENLGRAINGENPSSLSLFLDSQWDAQRFQTALRDAIGKKNLNYSRRKLRVDFLVLYSGEPWLSASQVAQWLPLIKFEELQAINAGFLLLDYEPGQEARTLPLFHLFGDVPHQCGGL